MGRLEILIGLRDRLKAATGPDRALSDDLLVALCGWTKEPVLRIGDDYFMVSPHGTKMLSREAPDPCASIDAAVTLVPEDCGIEIHRYWMKEPETPVWSALIAWGISGRTAEAYDMPSAALALVLARIDYEIQKEQQA